MINSFDIEIQSDELIPEWYDELCLIEDCLDFEDIVDSIIENPGYVFY